MKKIVLFLFAVIALPWVASAQTTTWTDSFENRITPNATQVKKWNDWKAQLQPGKYSSMTISGTYDTKGVTCTDPAVVNAMAQALKAGTDYTSSSTCDGNTWSVCARYGGEVWINPPAQCSGANCPTGYIIRVGIGNLNWGGINTATCTSNPNQRMIFTFEAPADVELSHLKLGSSVMCTGPEYDVTFTIKNNGPEVSDQERVFKVEAPGTNTIFEAVKLNNLLVGKDTTVTLKTKFKTSYTGTNVPIRVVNATVDDVPANDTSEVTVTILQSPSGNRLVTQNGYKGVENAGVVNDPDIGIAYQTLDYEFGAPNGYTLNDFGTSWTVTNKSTTLEGNPIPSQYFNYTAPSGSDNGKISLTIPLIYEDSTLIIQMGIESIANGCDSSITRHIYVAPTPRPNFIFKNTCVGSPTEFTNTSSIKEGLMFYEWDFDDGTTTDQQEPFHTYKSPGTYKVKLTAISDYGVRVDTTIDVTIGEQPDAKFSYVNACEGLDLTFTNTSSINNGTMTYLWDLGDGNTSTNKDVQHLYSQPGVYTVVLTATSGEGCVGTMLRQAVQFARPTADFKVTGANTCGNDPVHFENTSTIEMNEKTGAVWTFGDGTGLTRSNTAIHKYATPGTRTVKMVAYSQFGCLDSIEKQVEVIAGPEVEFAWDRNCSESPVVFTNNTNEQGANTIYEWNFGDGNTSTDKSPSYTYGTLGKRTVTLYAEADNGCKQEIAKTIVILPEPNIDFEVDDVCAGEFTQFRNNSDVEFGELEYTWEFGDGNSSNEGSPTYRYTQQGGATYDVTLKGQQPGSCEGSVTKSVQVFEKPECGFTYSISDEDRTKVTLTPNNPNYDQYQWVVEGSGLQSTDANPEFDLPFAEKLYTVKLKITTSDGCECNEQTELRSSWEVGVDQLNKVAIQVYPNPTNGEVYIQMDASEFVSVELVDLTGKSLMNSTTQNLDLSRFSNGIYILRVSTTNNGVQNVKVQVNK